MSITIRPLGDADREAWEELFRGYIHFYEAKVPDDVIALAWQRLLKQEDGFLALVAVDESGRLVGLAHALFHRSTGRRRRTVILRIFTSITPRAGTVWAAL